MPDTYEEAGSVVRIASTSHRVRVIAEDRADVAVEGDADVASDGGPTTIGAVRSRLVIRVPERTDVVIGSTSGRVNIEGPVGKVAVTTESGDVTVHDAITVDVRSDSSRVEVTKVDADCRIQTRSGRVRVEYCGGVADLATKKGRIRLEAASGPVRAQCTSGEINIGLVTAQDVMAETITGRIAIALPAGTRAYRSEDWEMPASAPDGYDCTVLARSMSGRVTVGTT